MPEEEIRTKAVDDLLKAVYELQRQDAAEAVPTTSLVTDMIKRLADPGDDGEPLLDHKPYHGVRLTARGEKIALEVIRHHRLIELYLVEKLGYGWDEVHAEAERLEHVISEKLEARMAAALGNPTFDPHGDPIPALDGSLPAAELTLLAELQTGHEATVSRITDQSSEALRYLSELGLVPGARVGVQARSPLGDMLTVSISDTRHTISKSVARMVLVEA
jgi:DtxR family transcriptional regulator, Mn-dependent transcriptional regulator